MTLGMVEIARRYLDMHTLGFVLSNDERQEISRIMASFSAARTAHREILPPISPALATQPATSQEDARGDFGVGQDELVAGIKRALQHPAGDHDGWTDAGMEDAFFRWPVIVNALNEALAEPVPTGKGVSAPDRIWLCGFDTDHGDISWSSSPNPTDDPEVDGKQVEYVRPALAIAPTTPDPLEDLLAALRSWQPENDDRILPLLLAEAGRREAGEYGVTDAHHVIAFLLHRLDLRAALATQPVTSQPEEAWMNDPRSLDAGLPATSQEWEGKGTFACPICGDDKPHHHTAPVVNAHQTKGSRK